MGWVTLTMRKKTLKVQHNNYELELLQISSQRRALARGKRAQLAALKAQQTAEINSLAGYDQAKENYQEQLESKDKDNIATAQFAYQEAKAEYEQQKAQIQAFYEDEKEDLEAETTEQENELDEEQTELESIIESISQELQAVSQQISQDIQSSTIKLA